MPRISPPPQPKAREAITEDAISAFLADIERYIASKVDELAAQTPGVPRQVVENLVSVRSNGCACKVALQLMEQV
jgi:hypothetical protein